MDELLFFLPIRSRVICVLRQYHRTPVLEGGASGVSGSLKVLLVTSSRRPDHWIIPGGGIEPEEEPSVTAIREVLEEAGVCGKLGRCLGVFENVSAIEFQNQELCHLLPVVGPPAWWLGEGLTTHHRKKQLVANPYNKPRSRTDSLARPQQSRRLRWAGHVAQVHSFERDIATTPLTRQRQIQMERSLTPVSERVGVEGGRKQEKCTVIIASHNVLASHIFATPDENGESYTTQLHALYSSPDIIRNIKSRRLRWAGHVARMGESRNAYRVLVGRPEGIKPLGRPRRKWEGNTKIDLREVGYDDREWINVAQDRDQWRAYVRAAMNLRVP
ncbi:hypothetical protein ANN_23885 [Periplaneta americana]|uniref:Nudix hydrolase domain-containing protein n=1 Tax=Periplaneta americana TaxID=6978 RepID=A0ABQ8S1R5_PERAM|nr:hypothetical protein ANN_23885 [Periplaneta americana]